MSNFLREARSGPLQAEQNSVAAIVSELNSGVLKALAEMGRIGEEAVARAGALTDQAEEYRVANFGEGPG